MKKVTGILGVTLIIAIAFFNISIISDNNGIDTDISSLIITASAAADTDPPKNNALSKTYAKAQKDVATQTFNDEGMLVTKKCDISAYTICNTPGTAIYCDTESPATKPTVSNCK